MNERVDALLAKCARSLHSIPEDEGPFYTCWACADTGLVLVGDDDHHGTYRPCATCNPAAFALWREGHWSPFHRGCATCRPGRRRSPGTSHHDEIEAEKEARNSGYAERERSDLF